MCVRLRATIPPALPHTTTNIRRVGVEDPNPRTEPPGEPRAIGPLLAQGTGEILKAQTNIFGVATLQQTK